MKSQFKHIHSSTNIAIMLQQLQAQQQKREEENKNMIQKKRSIHLSQSMRNSRTNSPRKASIVCQNSVGSLFDPQLKLNAYRFMPKYVKNELISPDRVFAKGKLGKRFTMKMKDSSKISFGNRQNHQIDSVCRREQKDKTIVGRKMEQYCRLVCQDDGRVKAKVNTLKLKNHKFFHHSQGQQFFSQFTPTRGINEATTQTAFQLYKTVNSQRSWKPFSRAALTPNQRGTMTPIQQQRTTFIQKRGDSRHAHTACFR